MGQLKKLTPNILINALRKLRFIKEIYRFRVQQLLQY